MRIIAADDESLALETLMDAITEAVPEVEIHGFEEIADVLGFAAENICDIAFLDIEMRGMSGILLAKKLKEINPNINIIFVTGYSQYMGDAFSLRASGYLMKPATKEAVLKELENLRNPIALPVKNRVRFQTFGNFDMFIDGKLFPITRPKVKELLAYLVDRRGSSASTAGIAAILWEDGQYDRARQKNTQKVISRLMQTLKEAGVQDIIIKGYNCLAIDTEKVDCDYYMLLGGSTAALNMYTNEYMAEYSWAEMTCGELSQRKKN